MNGEVEGDDGVATVSGREGLGVVASTVIYGIVPGIRDAIRVGDVVGDVLFDSHVDIIGIGTPCGGLGDGDGIGADIFSGNIRDKWIWVG